MAMKEPRGLLRRRHRHRLLDDIFRNPWHPLIFGPSDAVALAMEIEEHSQGMGSAQA